MKLLTIIFILLFGFAAFAQIQLIPSGTSNSLWNLSIKGKSVIINSGPGYLMKSYDECGTLIPISAYKPTPANYVDALFRVDTSTMYLLAVQHLPTVNKIYKSTNGGYNWTKKLDTTATGTQTILGIPALMAIAFFDSLNGVAPGTQNKLFLTNNGGNTWTNTSYPINYLDAMAIHGDSTIIVGGTSWGQHIALSKDRGLTWPHSLKIDGHSPTDFAFLNKDTIFCNALNLGLGDFANYFLRSFNGGKTWDVIPSYNTKNPGVILPEITPQRIAIKSRNEIYLTGVNESGVGIILKTTDMGSSWYYFNTGIKSQLIGIGFLNDSTALISGSGGTLFKWNFKGTSFVGINEYNGRINALKIFPNPSSDKLMVEYGEFAGKQLDICILSSLGQNLIKMKLSSSKTEVPVSSLPKGVYFISFSDGQRNRVEKFIKE